MALRILPALWLNDYGDNWIVEITRQKNCDDLLDNGQLTHEELAIAINTVAEKHRPVCIHQDGMFVVDDVGGLDGFIDLLRTIYEPADLVEKEEMQTWAHGMGWSTRRTGNKEML